MFSSLGWYGAAATAASLLLAFPSRAQTVPPSDTGELSPDAPLDPMPDIGVDWPTLDAEPAAEQAAAPTDAAAETAYAFRLDGLDAAASPLLRQRFAEASTLDANDGEPANAAQLDRRAREDAALL
ncbi:MAG TPA: outer membrane protein assembly factor, partial [Sphingomonas sp.]